MNFNGKLNLGVQHSEIYNFLKESVKSEYIYDENILHEIQIQFGIIKMFYCDIILIFFII